MEAMTNTEKCFSPARATSPLPLVRPPPSPGAAGQYLAELLQEQHKIGPFVQVRPICGRLLNQEIMRISAMLSHLGVREHERLPIASPNQMHPLPQVPNFCGNGLSPWSGMLSEKSGFPRGTMGWQGAAHDPSYIVKKIMRLEVPTDAYPHFNFIGRLLGPRGNSLKRVEASTGCRVFIRGKGSIKDPIKEEQSKGRHGYEHLSEPTHILIEAELPADVIDIRLAQSQEILEDLLKPVEESQDILKRQQLRELAMLNSTYREDSTSRMAVPLPSAMVAQNLGSNDLRVSFQPP